MVAIVLQGLFDAFAHGLEAGEVDDGIDPVLGKGLPQALLVLAVQLIESGTFAGDGFDAVDDIGLGIGQVVHDDGVVAGVQQLDHGVAADIPSAAGD